MRLNLDEPRSRINGYEILEYLYQNGSETLEGITSYTGLSWYQVWNRLSSLLAHGYIEGTAKTPGFFSI